MTKRTTIKILATLGKMAMGKHGIAKGLMFSPQKKTRTWDRCYDFLKYFRRKIRRKNWRFLHKTKQTFLKI
jgi:hypothetical protein